MSINKEQMLEKISNMSVMEIMDFISDIEKKFGISSNDILNMKNKNTEDKKIEEKTEFSIYLKNIGNNKISVIKNVRSMLNLGLKEAKDLVESAPVLLKEKINKEDIDNFKKNLENAGAEIEIK